MSLYRTSVLSAISALVRLAGALAINKVLAVYAGPSGYALIAQLQSAASFAAGLGGGAFSNGIVKSTAQHFDDQERQRACWKTAFRSSLWASVLIGMALVAARDPLSAWLYGREGLSATLVWLALALPAITANSLFLATLNGKGEINAFVIATIAGSLISLLAMMGLTIGMGIEGALIAAATAPALSIFASALLISRTSWFRARDFWGRVERASLVELSKFGVMMLVTAICSPIAQVLIRNHLAESFGWSSAGHWQAVWKISEIYLMFITLTLGTYFLPRIAEIRSTIELRGELFRIYRFVLPLAMVPAIAIYLARDLVVVLLFTSDFAPMKELFAWQLAGDMVKVAAWILGYLLIGRAAVGAFVGTEIFFSASLVALTWCLTSVFGLQGAPLAYFVNYALYLATLTVLVRRLTARSG